MSEIAAKSIQTFINRVAVQVVTVIAGIVLARLVGASGKGSFTYAVTVLAMVQMVYAGVSAAVAWQYGKRRIASGAVGEAMLMIVVPSALLIGLALLCIGTFVHDQWPLVAAAIAVPCAIFTQASSAFFLADSDVRVVNAQLAIAAIGGPILYIPLLLFLHAGIAIVLWSWALAYVVSAVYTAVLLRPYFSKARINARTLLREQLTYGTQVSMNSIVSYLNFTIDVFLVMTMLGPKALGVYSVGIGLGQLMWQISRPITTAAFGRIARGDHDDAAELTAKCMRHSFALVCLASIVIFIFAPPLVVLVYGKAFAAAGLVVRVLIPGIIAYSMMPSLATFFSQQLGKPRIPLLFSTLSTAICAGVTAFLLPRVGIVGGAFATSVSYAIAFTLACIYFLKITPVRATSLFMLSAQDISLYKDVFRRAVAWPSGRFHAYQSLRNRSR